MTPPATEVADARRRHTTTSRILRPLPHTWHGQGTARKPDEIHRFQRFSVFFLLFFSILNVFNVFHTFSLEF